MKNYSSYTVQDFIMDEAFKDYVKLKHEEGIHYWNLVRQKYPEKIGEMEEASVFLQSIEFQESALKEEDKENIWEAIEQRTEEENSFIHYDRSVKSRPFRWWYAASILLPLIGIFVFWMNLTMHEKYLTGPGNQKSITLPDGSEVILNANSLLTVGDSWDEVGKREVWLEGEAYFKVEKQLSEETGGPRKKVKFVVHTSQVDVEVVGTVFNVKARNKNTEVVLSEGKVHLKGKEQAVELQPGEMVRASQSELGAKKKVNIQTYSAWTRNEFVFDDTPLSKIATMLSESYGYEVKNKVANQIQRISATSPISLDNLDMFLHKIELLYNVKIEKSGKVITISKN